MLRYPTSFIARLYSEIQSINKDKNSMVLTIPCFLSRLIAEKGLCIVALSDNSKPV